MILLVYVLFPTLFFYLVENIILGGKDWTIMGCLYFVVITLSTIGFGDYVPTLEHNHFPYFFVVLYQIVIFVWILCGLVTMKIWLEMVTDGMKQMYEESKNAVRSSLKTENSQEKALSNLIGLMNKETQMGHQVKRSSRTRVMTLSESKSANSIIVHRERSDSFKLIFPKLQINDFTTNLRNTTNIPRSQSEGNARKQKLSERTSSPLEKTVLDNFDPPHSVVDLPDLTECNSNFSDSSCYLAKISSSVNSVAQSPVSVYETPEITTLFGMSFV